MRIRRQDLARQLESMQRDIDRLRSDLATELRTGQIVIVDPESNERITLTATESTTSIMVKLPSPHGRTTGVELFAIDTPSGPEAGVAAHRQGEVVRIWSDRGQNKCGE